MQGEVHCSPSRSLEFQENEGRLNYFQFLLTRSGICEEVEGLNTRMMCLLAAFRGGDQYIKELENQCKEKRFIWQLSRMLCAY